MIQYLSDKFSAQLKQNQLSNLDQTWAYEGEWFEAPNRARGGWSGVNLIALPVLPVEGATDKSKAETSYFYMKRQSAFTRRTFTNFLHGEPTFLREYQVIKYLAARGVGVPELAFFAYKKQQAVLITAALQDYVPLSDWFLTANAVQLKAFKKSLLRAVAKAVKAMHAAGVQHRALYAKHIFVKQNTTNNAEDVFQIAMIDFEKSRITPWAWLLKLADLITLNYRTEGLSRTDRLYFFKCYFGLQKLTPAYKFLCRYLMKKSRLKSS